jgi:hypothetical protein
MRQLDAAGCDQAGEVAYRALDSPFGAFTLRARAAAASATRA